MHSDELNSSGALVSFIVPAYNAEATIGTTLESLLNQDFRRWEAIVVDDGSEDSTETLVRSYMAKDNRIRILVQENKGVSFARNRAIEDARTPYVAFLDADDRLTEGFLVNVANALVSFFPDVLVCNYSIKNKASRFGFGEFRGAGSDFLSYALRVNSATFPCWMFVVASDLLCLSGVRFNEDRAFGEDQEFVLKLLILAQNVVSLPESIAVYEYCENRSGSAMRSASERQFEYADAMAAVFTFAETHSPMQFRGQARDVLPLLRGRILDAICFSAETALCNGMSLCRARTLVADRLEKLLPGKLETRTTSYKCFMRLWSLSEPFALFLLRAQGSLSRFARKLKARFLNKKR